MRAKVWSPMAAPPAPLARPATMATGSSVSVHARMVNTSGCSTTRGASRRGTTIVAPPLIKIAYRGMLETGQAEEPEEAFRLG